MAKAMSTTDKEETDKSSGTVDFGFKLMRKLGMGNSKVNLVLSPYSIRCALSLLVPAGQGDTLTALSTSLFGTKDGDKAKDDMFPTFLAQMKVLGSLYTSNPVLRLANSVWVNSKLTLKSDYVQAICGSDPTPSTASSATADEKESDKESMPCVQVDSVDVSEPAKAAKSVNAWVAKVTQGLITDVVSPSHFNSLFCACLVNAIYFKGKFERAFDKSLTEPDRPFYTDMSRKTVKSKCSMMVSKTKHWFAHTDEFMFARLDYEGCSLSLVLALTVKECAEGKTVPPDDLLALTFRDAKIVLQLPRFEYEWGRSIKEEVSDSGLDILFGGTCDLSGMIEDMEQIYVSDVIHKAMIKVDEEGTVAAAATAVVTLARSMPTPVPNLIFDIPFDFFIMDRERNIVLFSGHVVQP